MKAATVPTHTLVDTSNPNIKRWCDRNGDWQYYYLVKEKKYVMAVNHILRLGFAKPGLLEWAKNMETAEIERRFKSAGEEGTRTHQAIKDLVSGLKVNMSTPYHNDNSGKKEVLNDNEWDNLMAFERFCLRYQPEVVDQEFAVAGQDYAGTADFFGTMLVPEDDKCFPSELRGKRVTVLLDWKTSGRLWPDYPLQISAYWQEAKKKYPDFFKAYPAFGVLVRLGTSHKVGYEVWAMTAEEMEANFSLFMDALRIAYYQEPEFKGESRDIPTSFFIPLKKATLIKPKKEKNGRRITPDGRKRNQASAEGKNAKRGKVQRPTGEVQADKADRPKGGRKGRGSRFGGKDTSSLFEAPQKD
jgi:hypothetical protein